MDAAKKSTLENNLIWIIDVAYWKSNEKPDTCGGYKRDGCKDQVQEGEPCEHFGFCSRKDLILGQVIEREEAEQEAPV